MDLYKQVFPSTVPATPPYPSPPTVNPGLTQEELMTLIVLHALLSHPNFSLHTLDEIGGHVRRVIDSMRTAL